MKRTTWNNSFWGGNQRRTAWITFTCFSQSRGCTCWSRNYIRWRDNWISRCQPCQRFMAGCSQQRFSRLNLKTCVMTQAACISIRFAVVFFQQYDGAQSLAIPTGYDFRVEGKLAQPNLMQRLAAYRILSEKRVNWSGVGAGQNTFCNSRDSA